MNLDRQGHDISPTWATSFDRPSADIGYRYALPYPLPPRKLDPRDLEFVLALAIDSLLLGAALGCLVRVFNGAIWGAAQIWAWALG